MTTLQHRPAMTARRQEAHMFTTEYRDHVRARVLDLVRTDPRVTAGALTGSTAVGAQDAWSDIDVAFGIAHGIIPAAVLHDWTAVLALGCRRLGEDALFGRGVDRLPAAVTGPLAEALVRSLDEPELRRALGVATACLISELEAWDPALCARLTPPLHEFGATQAIAERGRSPRGLPEQ